MRIWCMCFDINALRQNQTSKPNAKMDMPGSFFTEETYSILTQPNLAY